VCNECVSPFLAILEPKGEQTVRLILGNYKHFQGLVMVRTGGLEPPRGYPRARMEIILVGFAGGSPFSAASTASIPLTTLPHTV